jgi:hypothetical protein
MLRFVRIGIAMVVSCAAVVGAHSALGLGPEFIGPGLTGLVDIGLGLAAALLMSLSDREYFWAMPPKHRGSKSGTHATR